MLRSFVAGEIPLSLSEQLANWLLTLELVPDFTYRVDVDGETRSMTVYEYGTDANGKIYYVPRINDVARREPYTVPLFDLPPFLTAELVEPTHA